METGRFSPREFLQARHPERFSDSVVEQVAELDRSLLEYHLDTLTNRNQEAQFETFARKLAEHTICPNLVPQTGPMGGGDAKVDTETYPVANDLALAWYVGNSGGAHTERWAFAFSAKRVWRDKLRSDIQKIADTNRDYRKAFFLSNQFIRSKTRGELQDELSAQHGFGVVILDRSWILDKTFGLGLQELATEHLGIHGVARTLIRRGPLDLQREQDLKEIDDLVTAACKEQRFGPQLMDDAIESALIARSLERHVDEIMGRFDRAETIGAKCGTQHQRNQLSYHRAWTAAFWQEDYEHFVRYYMELEKHTADSTNPFEMELRTNLWFVLFSLVRAGHLNEKEVVLGERTQALIRVVSHLIDQEDRPSASHNAQALLLSIRLVTSEPEDIHGVLAEYAGLIKNCSAFIGFPMQAIADYLMHLGEHLGNLPEYQQLFEILISVTSQREQEVSTARLLLRRAAQQHDMGEPAEAIRTLGRAMVRLYKHESRQDIIRALYLCACCYEQVDLLWAARGTLLAAASIAVQEFWTYENVTALQGRCFNKLKWVELRLGRVPFVLAWHEIDLAVRAALAEKGYDQEQLAPGESAFDAILGLLLLRTDVWQLKWLEKLPDVLDRYRLHGSSLALRYALGPDTGVKEDLQEVAKGDVAIEKYFLQWRAQPAGKDLPSQPSYCDERTVTFESRILGCAVSVVCQNDVVCLAVAESLLAALEGLMSTGLADGIMAKEPELSCEVRLSPYTGIEWKSEFTDRHGRPHWEILCPTFDPNHLTFAEQKMLKKQLARDFVELLPRVFVFKDVEDTARKLFGDDNALDRALHFCCSFITAGGVLGNNPRIAISEWLDATATCYPLTRSLAWYEAARSGETPATHQRVEGSLSKEDPPPGVFDLARMKHTDVETVSLIRDALWDKAEWHGTVFLCPEEKTQPPIMALLFADAVAGMEIFKHWIKELGTEDKCERLFVGIVRGISQKSPYSYRILFAANPQTALQGNYSGPRIAAIAGRVHRMDATSEENLSRFLV